MVKIDVTNFRVVGNCFFQKRKNTSLLAKSGEKIQVAAASVLIKIYLEAITTCL